jgi:MFS family permease
MVMLFVSFKQAFMTVVLEREYHVDQAYHGWIISMPALFYVISGNIVGVVIDKAPRRVFICFAFLIMAVSNFLMGPSKLLFLPPELWIFFVGYAINGISQGFIFIPILPEVLEAVYQKRKIVEGDDEIMDGVINDKAAALYGLFYAIGAISAPLLGSFVYNLLNNDWWYTCDVFAIISSVYVVIFFVFNIMPDDIHKERQQRQEMAELMLQSEHFHRVININIIPENDG